MHDRGRRGADLVSEIRGLKERARSFASLGKRLRRNLETSAETLGRFREAQGQRAAAARKLIDENLAERGDAPPSSVLRALAARLEAEREQERSHLAREIHDVLGQELTVLKMNVAWVMRRLSEPGDERREDALARLGEMIDGIDATLSDVRRIAAGLRPALLDDLGLIAALEWQVQAIEARSGVHTSFTGPADECGVDADRATALFRIAQELLTNAVRHGGPSNIDVSLDCAEGAVHLTVFDDGRGIREEDALCGSALGLVGVRERARAFGGELDIHSLEGRGTVARVHFPRAKESAPP